MTELLLAWERRGDRSAFHELVPIVHQGLRRLARLQLRAERINHTLQTTALVNEAFIRLVDLRRIRWQDRAHFLSLSARLMRRILVDHARSRNYQKRGGGAVNVTLDEMVVASGERGRRSADSCRPPSRAGCRSCSSKRAGSDRADLDPDSAFI